MSDGLGKVWRQPVTTTGLSWNQVASACPTDGISPCTGIIGGRDLTGWVWATAPQLTLLFGQIAPEILTDPMAAAGSVFAGIGLVNYFTPTQWFANTYSSSEWVGGWTASRDAGGSPIAGGGGWSTPPHAGGIGIGPTPNPDEATAARGVFMWKADGSDGRTILAVDDAGSVAAPGGGTAVDNVLANDQLAGAAATTATVTLTQLSSSQPSIRLDLADGSVEVDYGTPVGPATLNYRICETTNLTLCATATVTIDVTGNLIDAVDDAGSTTTRGGTAVADVRANDNANVPTTLAQLSASGGMALDTGSGAVTVAAGTAAGTGQLRYRICETASPTNCDEADVAVEVTDLLVDAVDDAGTVPASSGGTAVGNVLSNDTIDGATATTTTGVLHLASTTSPNITLDLATGAVRVLVGATAGLHTLTYRLCEAAMPANCDVASVRVTVVAQTFIVTPSRLTLAEQATGSFTVRLSQQPASPVVAKVAFYAGTATITPSIGSVTFTPTNWNVPVTITVKAPKDSDKVDNAATIHVSAAGIATAPVIIKVLDTNRSSGSPTPTIALPLNGQTVTGVIDFTGTGVDVGGTVVEGRFSVDGNRIWTDTNSTGSYRVLSRWNTATVPNGWHTLELRVTDNAGNDGRMTIKVLVAN